MATRREFLKIAGVAGGGALVGGLVGRFALGGTTTQPAPQFSVYNWSFYIDETLLTEFGEQAGVRVVYDTFESADEVWAKIATGTSGYDLAVLVDYRVAEAITGNLLLPIDGDRIANTRFLLENFAAPGYDPTLAYSRPYFWGTTGIGYNSTNTDVSSWAQMFDTQDFLPAHDGKVTMIDDLRETIGAALFALGYGPNEQDPGRLQEARDLLIAQRPFLARYGGADDYFVSLVDGTWDASHAWNGDVVVMQEENEDLAYAVPQEGAIMWVDNMVIPIGARNVDAAHEFMDFILEPANQIRNAEAAGYPSPSKVATDYLPEDFKADPAIYPPEDVLAKLVILSELSPAASDLYDEIWLEVTGGG